MIPLIALAAVASTGTYFEARTCSLLAGPCHYSGEVMVDGRTAVAIWKFESGPFVGAEAAAVIESPANLSLNEQRTTRIFVEGGSTADITAFLKTCANLGNVISTQTATIDLTKSTAKINGVYEATFTEGACSACAMPGQLWYSPARRRRESRSQNDRDPEADRSLEPPRRSRGIPRALLELSQSLRQHERVAVRIEERAKPHHLGDGQRVAVELDVPFLHLRASVIDILHAENQGSPATGFHVLDL